jgi:hypothetical protein
MFKSFFPKPGLFFLGLYLGTDRSRFLAGRWAGLANAAGWRF